MILDVTLNIVTRTQLLGEGLPLARHQLHPGRDGECKVFGPGPELDDY